MKELISIIVAHVRGASGYTNPMMSGLLHDELPHISSKDLNRLSAIAYVYTRYRDEDIANTAKWLLAEINKYKGFTHAY